MSRITDWSLTFEQQVARRIWPEETRGGYLLDVWQLADEAVSAGDQPHAIAAIFLYQQLVEEMLYLVDYWCYFEQAIALYPTRFGYAVAERLMFGQLINRIRQRQDFPGKDTLLQRAQNLNAECRIPAAHELLHRGTLPRIGSLAQECKALFQQIMGSFGDVRTHFYARYDLLAERTGIQRESHRPNKAIQRTADRHYVF
jgi:hypothetical protein